MGLSNELSCEAGSFSCCHNPHRFLQSEVLRLYFPVLEPWVAWSVLLPHSSSRFICVNVGLWGLLAAALPALFHNPPPHWVCQSPPCCESSPPLLVVWMNVSSLSPWLLDFHTVLFSVSSGCFFVFKLLLSLFWLCEEAQCVYLCLHLGQKFKNVYFLMVYLA